jgi:hypothetical protein
LDNKFDGVDINFDDDYGLQSSNGEDWLIKCTKAIRAKMPASSGYILSHSPKASYFLSTNYAKGGYKTVHA